MNHATSTGIPLEIVVAITATIAAVLNQPVGSFAVTSIQPEQPAVGPAPSVWGKAGVLESHALRRGFGLRNR